MATESLDEQFKRVAEELGKIIKKQLDDKIVSTYSVEDLIGDMQIMINKSNPWNSSSGSCGWYNEDEDGWQSSSLKC